MSRPGPLDATSDVHRTPNAFHIAQSEALRSRSSRQPGHASITTTLNVYTHLFDHGARWVLSHSEQNYAAELIAGSARPNVPDR